MNTSATHANKKGFTLVELIAVLTVIGVLVGVMTLPFLGLIESARMRAERQNLAMLAAEIKATFRQDNIDLNISALLGDMPFYAGPDPREAVFEIGTPADGVAVSANAWYARLAIMRGQDLPGGALNATSGDIYDIAFNAYNARRVLIAGPREPGRQRYLLLSFMFHDGPALPNAPTGGRGDMVGGVYIPTPDYDAWFDALYNHTWGETAGVPTGWGWNGAMQAAWDVKNARGRTYAQRVVAERIVQPRYNVVVNNNSPKTTVPILDGAGAIVDTVDVHPDRIFIYTNMLSASDKPSASLWTRIDARESPPAAGGELTTVFVFPNATTGILEGRRVVISRQRNAAAVDASAAAEVVSMLINENTTYTAQ